MRNKQWYWGLALTAALAVTLPAGAQQKQQTQDQKPSATKPGTKKPAPFDPCTGSGLPPTSQAAPFTPGSTAPGLPSHIARPAAQTGGSSKPQAQKAQKGSSLPPSPGATKKGRKNEAKEKKKNAFPLAKSEAAQKKSGQVSAPRPSAAQANPFPQAQSQAAQEQRQKAEGQPPAQQGAYSSSSQRMPGMNALGGGPGTVQGGMPSHPSYDPALGKKDDKVGHFYLQRGNWAGAYGRYKQAAQVNPKDIKAVIGLAIAADHLGKRREAIENYKLYLMVLPDGPHSKQAMQALKRLDKQVAKQK